ncbi:MAG: right-handed parallel beta-helix repeat-containing protein [bacterium]
MNKAVIMAMSIMMTGMMTTAEEVTLYVSPKGQDIWSGTLITPNATKTDGPLATLTGARDTLRRLRNSGKLPDGATVQFQDGRYEQITPVIFKEEDSGTASAPIIFTAAPKTLVRITGGVMLWQMKTLTNSNTLQRLPEVARGKVKVISLPAQGITDYGIEPVGSSASPASGIQLIYGDEVMNLARWPNEGYVKIVDIPDGSTGNTFTYAEDRPSQWVDEVDPHGQGYWAHDWAACAIAFDKINPATKTITQKVPGSNYGFRKGGYWFGYNILCELDQPGEYYVDRLDGKLYFWPTDKPANTSAEVSVGTQLVKLENVAHIQFRGLTFENCRGAAIQINKGERVTIAGCTLRNIGHLAVSIQGGKAHRIAGCEMTRLGDGGIKASAGNDQTLEHCNHVYDNNHIHDYGRFSMTYGAAIQVGGCGHLVSHNLIHDGPHVAILYGGRENVMEYNEVHSICLTSGEMGAFYTGRNWTLVGNVIHGNYIHDIYNPRAQRNRAIMLDDGGAGTTMTQNLIVRVAEGISLSAVGNVIDNNVFVNCHPAISGWQTYETPASVTPPKGVHPGMVEELFAVPVDASPWKERYTWLAMLRNAVRDKTLRAPETRTRVERNVIWGGPQEWMVHYKNYPRTTNSWLIGENNLAGVDPLFVNAEKDDYRMKPDSPAFKIGFKALPIEKMGLYASPERAVWPVKHTPRLICTRLTPEKQ